ncbi:MAG: cobalamin biosynthesis protein [Clostridia bacterium]|nr:cobalamin biosynthesis protein [Clostridia bacterium]
MRAVLFAFTARGKRTALRVRDALSEADILLRTPEKLADADFDAYNGALPDYVGGVFDRDALVFVGAAGIAVRAVAPHVASKRSDPAVLCLDEAGRFVIPILSGHIGGANRLARRLAGALGATSVITTATDVNGRFSVDAWAAEHGMAITSMPLAKRVSAEILTRDIPFFTDAARPERLADGLFWSDAGDLGVCVSVRDLRPFEETLLLVPRALRVGIGCRRGTSAGAIHEAVEKVLSDNSLRIEAVREAASIDLKSDEPGLLECCRALGWPITFYTSEALNAVEGDFLPSAFVKRTVGVDNVCARAAAASGGRIIVPKTALNGVTVSVAELKWGIEFG